MALGSRFEDALGDPSSAQESVVRLGEMAGVEFDRVYAFVPHTSGSQIESRLGFKWWCAGRLGIEMKDDRSLVVFVRGNRVIKYFYVRRWHGSFDGTLARGVPPAEAVLRAYTRSDGLRVITKADVSKEAR